MLPFFRKIRWRLSQDNQFLKYSRYAVGEILLVVIGILIALQINNWNEDRKSKLILKSHLETLKSDLESDIKNLELLMNNASFRYHSMHVILKRAGFKENNVAFSNIPQFKGDFFGYKSIPAEIDSTFLQFAFTAVGYISHFDATMNGLDQLKNSGLLSFIDDKNIIEEIDDYYIRHERFLGKKEWQSLIYYKQYWITLLTENGFSPDAGLVINDVMEWLQKDPEAVAALRNLVTNAEFIYANSILQIEIGNKLIENIDKTIESL